MIQYPDFIRAYAGIKDYFKYAYKVKTEKWQGTPTKPEMETYEILNFSFTTPLRTEDLDHYRKDIQPNLPWADDHFLERVCGEPINPGEQWKKWPWGNNAQKFLDENGQFNHNYMERYWPKYAGMCRTDNSKLLGSTDAHNLVTREGYGLMPHEGIRFDYGDLNDVINLLRDQPNTRQAYMPIFFPEDTGVVHGGRVPCSLGYHFIHRNGYLHINYYLRSCEIYRHFKDDCYLTVRLLLHVLDSLRELDTSWNKVKPGFYSMHITSLHCFVNDKEKL